MPTLIFPISAIAVPLNQDWTVEAHIHGFGSGQEQRIVTEIPWGSRADGVGGSKTFVGTRRFSLISPRLLFRTQPVAGNANLDNSVEKIINFWRDLFYNSTTGKVQFQAFYWYNPNENDDTDTWTGDSVTSGTNSRGEAVTNVTGRYLVRLAEPKLSLSFFVRCLNQLGLEVVEVAA